MWADNNIPRIPIPVDRESAITLNWIFTGVIIVGNLTVILLVLGSEKLRKSSKYVLVASLAFADLSDGGCFLPMWTDILINLRVHFSCKARYIAGALGYSIACVCSLSIVAINTDFTFRRAFANYKGYFRGVVIAVLLLLSWTGPFVTLQPLVESGMRGSNPAHCFFTLEHPKVTLFIILAFLIPSGAVIISTLFVIFVHLKTREGSERPSFTADKAFPSDVVITACLTLMSYLPFGVLQLSAYYCSPQDCYFAYISRFLVIGNLVYAKSAILPWIWLFSRQFREEIKDMFFLSSPPHRNTSRAERRQI